MNVLSSKFVINKNKIKVKKKLPQLSENNVKQRIHASNKYTSGLITDQWNNQIQLTNHLSAISRNSMLLQPCTAVNVHVRVCEGAFACVNYTCMLAQRMNGHAVLFQLCMCYLCWYTKWIIHKSWLIWAPSICWLGLVADRFTTKWFVAFWVIW